MANLSTSIERKNSKTSIVNVNVNGFAPISRPKSKPKYPRVTLAVGEIETKHWDREKERPKASWDRLDGGYLSKELDFLRSHAQQAYHMALEKTPTAFRTQLNILQGRTPIAKQAAVKRAFLTDIVSGWLESTDVKANTIDQYRPFAKKVEAYERAQAGKRVNMANVQQEDLEAILRWIKAKYDLNPSTMWSQQKYLNKAITFARSPDGLQRGDIKTLRKERLQEVDKSILDWSDLARIIAYVPKTDLEKDMQTFTVGLALTGARISDWRKLFETIDHRNNVLCAHFVCAKKPSPTVSPIIFEPFRILFRANGIPKFRAEQNKAGPERSFRYRRSTPYGLFRGAQERSKLQGKGKPSHRPFHGSYGPEIGLGTQGASHFDGLRSY